jgi:NADH:ubiquinone oxidoreductase subunit K
MAVAAAEVSVGLALIVAVFRRTGSVEPDALEPDAQQR